MNQARIPQLRGSLLMRLRGELDFRLGRPVRERMITTNGLRLLKPALNSIPEVKYSAMNDKRLLDVEQYTEFEQFMPQGFSFAGEPANQTAFGYCFDYSEDFGVERFLTKLEEETERIDENKKNKGDIVVYSNCNSGFYKPLHAGLYTGNDTVNSRWMTGGPVVNHPLEEFLQRARIIYLENDFSDDIKFYRKKE